MPNVSLGNFSMCDCQTLPSSLYENKELQGRSLNWSYWILNIWYDSDDLCFKSKIVNKWRAKARQCADAQKLAAWVLVVDSLQIKFSKLELSCRSVFFSMLITHLSLRLGHNIMVIINRVHAKNFNLFRAFFKSKILEQLLVLWLALLPHFKMFY